MALQTLVKISNVTNLSDARYCAGMGVDMLGFSMDADSEQYVAPEKVAEIRAWLAGVQIVGETAATDPAVIEALLEAYQPDMLQIEEAALLPYAASLGLPLIVKEDLGLLTLDQLEALSLGQPGQLAYLLLESKATVSFDEDLKAALRKLADCHPLLLGTGISPDNVQVLLSELPIRGIALTGGEEDRPGYREFGELMDILETLETED